MDFLKILMWKTFFRLPDLIFIWLSAAILKRKIRGPQHGFIIFSPVLRLYLLGRLRS